MDKEFKNQMAQAWKEVQEASKKKLDPVDQDELKGTHAQRKDKDIDNDGKVDKSDEYLHNRRKAVSKAIKGKAEVSMNTAKAEQKEEVEKIDEISRDLARSYIRKAATDNADRKDKVMKPFPMKQMGKNIEMHKKFKKREAGIGLAGKKAYGIGGKAKVSATESVEELAKESVLPPVYARILEARDKHMNSGVKQPMDDNLPGAGAKKMVADHKPVVDDTEEKGHKDVVKAGAPAAPVAKKRPNDNAQGDKNVINPVKGMK